MGAWGTALAYWGVWSTRGTPAALEQGRRALANARVMRHASPRERRYVAAAGELFADGRDAADSRRAYAAAMAQVSRDYPDDTNAAALAALALFEKPESDLAAALSNRREARRAIAAAQRRGEQAGVAHFAMLTADNAAAAARVVDAAYASAGAGATAYALHLPSHVFIRRGLWSEAIDANLQAADAARRDGQVEDELHALDALVYALLQLGKDTEATTIAARAQALGERVTAYGSRAVEARAAVMAMPARVPLERGEWSRAAALPVPPNAAAWTVQVTHLVKALGSARSGDAEMARRELAEAGMVDPTGAEDARGPVAAAGVASLRQVAEAWMAFAEGQVDSAVDELRRAAALEATRDAADWPAEHARQRAGKPGGHAAAAGTDQRSDDGVPSRPDRGAASLAVDRRRGRRRRTVRSTRYRGRICRAPGRDCRSGRSAPTALAGRRPAPEGLKSSRAARGRRAGRRTNRGPSRCAASRRSTPT